MFIKDKKYYFSLSIDSEIRFILAFHLTQSIDSNEVFILMNQAKSINNPKHFITDKLPSYNEAVKTVLNEITHVPVLTMSSDTNNNLIKSFNKTFKSLYKYKKDFNSFKKLIT